MSDFGQTLRRLREEADLRQSQLARQAYISQPSLSRYESGHQTPDAATAQQLDELLGAGGELLLLASGDPTPDVLTPDDQERLDRVMESPHRLDGATVTTLADLLAAHRRLDDHLSPEILIPAARTQSETITTLVRQGTGQYRADLAEVAAEYVQFVGWLLAETRNDQAALRVLEIAEHAADEIGNGVLAAQAANFKGYLARQRRDWHRVARWFLTEHYTPGASVHQRLGAATQAAQGCAELGDSDTALRLLEVAHSLLDESAQQPPPRTAYWLNPNFHRLQLGLTNLSMGRADVAADHLADGLDNLPPDQQAAEWTGEFRDALATANQSR